MDIVTRIKIWTGACAAVAGDEDIKATLERSQQLLWAAEQGTQLSKNLENAAKLFGTAKDALGKVAEGVGKAESLCLDARALTEIHEAIAVLNQDGIIQRDGEAAALAFGKLLGGFGRLAHHLPPPADAYAAILEGCGGEFFNSMRKKLDPDARWKGIFSQVEGYR